MGIADRIILTLYTILMTVASVLTLLCSLGVFSDTGMVAFISHIPGNWVYAVGGVIMLLVSLLTFGIGAAVMEVIGIIEGIIYLTKTDQEFYQTYEAQQKEWF